MGDREGRRNPPCSEHWPEVLSNQNLYSSILRTGAIAREGTVAQSCGAPSSEWWRFVPQDWKEPMQRAHLAPMCLLRRAIHVREHQWRFALLSPSLFSAWGSSSQCPDVGEEKTLVQTQKWPMALQFGHGPCG